MQLECVHVHTPDNKGGVGIKQVTLEDIAKLAGVSRGMVDRVYHERGYVKAEKAALIRELLDRYDYRPNKLARALSVSQKKRNIKIILNSIGNDYFNDVIAGIQSAAEEFSSFGLQVNIEYLKGFAADDQLAAIRRLQADSIDGLVLTPVNHPEIAQELNQLVEAGLPVLTVNTDIDDCSRNLYIGCDYRQSGQMAGGFLTLMGRQRRLRVGIIQGSESAKGHQERLAGFLSVVENDPAIQVLNCTACNDDDELAYEQTCAMLTRDRPECLYVVAGGLAGAMKGIEKTDLPVRVIAHDLTPAAVTGLLNDRICVTIDQQPFQQGYQAVRALFEYIYQDNPLDQQSHAIQLAYVTKYNLPRHGQTKEGANQA